MEEAGAAYCGEEEVVVERLRGDIGDALLRVREGRKVGETEKQSEGDEHTDRIHRMGEWGQ